MIFTEPIISSSYNLAAHWLHPLYPHQGGGPASPHLATPVAFWPAERQPTEPPCSRWRALRRSFRLFTIPNTAFSLGQYVVSPTTHETECGRFRAAYALRRSRGDERHRRVFHFDTTFASRHAARLFAVTQAWMQIGLLKRPSY